MKSRASARVIQGSLSASLLNCTNWTFWIGYVREELSQRKTGKPAAVAAEIGNVADVIPHAAGDIDDELHIHRL